jgi:hypothetical protein
MNEYFQVQSKRLTDEELMEGRLAKLTQAPANISAGRAILFVLWSMNRSRTKSLT